MALLYTLLALCILPLCTANWPRYPPSGQPWHWGGGNTAAGYWFEEFEGVLETMQATYWNGTYWPTTIQWIGAFLDTLLASSDISFTNALEEYGGSVPGARTSSASIQKEIQTHFSETEAYYGDEDTIQIFGAAYDDAQWVVLEWLEAIKFINQYDSYAKSSLGQADTVKFAHRAHIFYHIVQNQFNESLCSGGLTWNPALAPYKNAITNELFVSSSVGMYLYFPGDSNTDPYPKPDYQQVTGNTLPPLPTLKQHDPSLLQNAIKEWNWIKSQPFKNAQGLIIDGFHISNDSTSCDEPNDMVYTYNQGVVLSGLRQLWEATGDSTYLTDGYDLITTTINATGWNARSWASADTWAGLGRNGIMEDYCDAPANCSQDAQAFKGIYFHHLRTFCDPLPTTTPLISGLTHTASSSLAAQHASNCASYSPWIQHNAFAALSTRNKSQIIGGWWGASYVNRTQGPWPGYAQPIPHGAQDPWNNPGILHQPPWVCSHGQGGCEVGGNGRATLDGSANVSRMMKRVFEDRRTRSRRDVNDQGLGRTVETESSGLGVVKAASDFALKRPAT